MANIKMKKKLIAVLCASMALSLAACGSKTAPTETTETETEMKIETETQALTETETKETEDPALGKDEISRMPCRSPVSSMLRSYMKRR